MLLPDAASSNKYEQENRPSAAAAIQSGGGFALSSPSCADRRE